MAFANNKNTSTVVSPVEKYLELNKGEFSTWNKEEKINEVHEMNKFIVLDVVYTVKGAEWNDTLNKYTSRYYSNEVRQFSEDMYVVKMDFVNGETLKQNILTGKWKQDIKPKLPTGAALHLGLVVFDLNDNTIKQIFLRGNNFYTVSQFIKGINGNSIVGLKTKAGYTNGSKDAKGNEVLVSEEFVDGLKGIEASKYKPRYMVEAFDTGEVYDDDNSIQAMAEMIDESYESRKKSYIESYSNGKVPEDKETKYAKLEEESEEIQVQDIENTFDQKPKVKSKLADDVSIEEVPW